MKDIEAGSVEGELSMILAALESSSFKSSLDDCIPMCNAGFKSNFDKTQGPPGVWATHSPYTVQKYGPHPLLILSGAMLASVTQSGAAGRIEAIGDRDAEIGTTLFYAGWQQFGTGKIPARRFLWLDEQSVDNVAEVFAESAFQIIFGA